MSTSRKARSKGVPRITGETLIALDACGEWRRAFKRLFPHGADVTIANAKKALPTLVRIGGAQWLDGVTGSRSVYKAFLRAEGSEERIYWAALREFVRVARKHGLKAAR